MLPHSHSPFSDLGAHFCLAHGTASSLSSLHPISPPIYQQLHSLNAQIILSSTHPINLFTALQELLGLPSPASVPL